MANSLGSAFRAFWHTMTSNDRHSSFDSPHRTGRHVPLNGGRNGVFTGVATASDSRADIRGRSLQRPNGSSPLVSPMRPPYGRVLPLGMVTEETPIPPELASANIEPTKLVEVESPRVSEDNKAAPSTTTTVTTMAPSETDLLPHKGDEPPKLNGKQPGVIEDGGMKTIEI